MEPTRRIRLFRLCQWLLIGTTATAWAADESSREVAAAKKDEESSKGEKKLLAPASLWPTAAPTIHPASQQERASSLPTTLGNPSPAPAPSVTTTPPAPNDMSSFLSLSFRFDPGVQVDESSLKDAVVEVLNDIFQGDTDLFQQQPQLSSDSLRGDFVLYTADADYDVSTGQGFVTMHGYWSGNNNESFTQAFGTDRAARDIRDELDSKTGAPVQSFTLEVNGAVIQQFDRPAAGSTNSDNDLSNKHNNNNRKNLTSIGGLDTYVLVYALVLIVAPWIMVAVSTVTRTCRSCGYNELDESSATVKAGHHHQSLPKSPPSESSLETMDSPMDTPLTTRCSQADFAGDGYKHEWRILRNSSTMSSEEQQLVLSELPSTHFENEEELEAPTNPHDHRYDADWQWDRAERQWYKVERQWDRVRPHVVLPSDMTVEVVHNHSNNHNHNHNANHHQPENARLRQPTRIRHKRF